MTRTEKKLKIRKLLRKDLVGKSLYKTTYKDIKKYFNIINDCIFESKLSPFNDVSIKRINGRTLGQVVIMEWKRKGTRQYHLEMLPEYRNKKEFVDTLGHEMVHLYQMANVGDTGNHNKLFYSFGPKLKQIGLSL